MDDEIVVKVNNVSKDFILLHERSGTVKGIFTSMFRKVTTKKEIQHALKDISLEIKKGEFFGIVGRNGSGKSTLLKILAGIYQPTKGSVTTTGKLVPFIELGVGFNPELSGKDNVYLNGAVLGFSVKEVEKMYDDIVSFAELERFMDQKLKNYSSGMQVRLAFSMAIRANADILLIDEVLAVGDADFQRKCFDYFKSLKKENKTVVFVSHDMNAIREYCERAVLIENSKIISTGKADQVANLYTRMFIEQKKGEDKDLSVTNRWGDKTGEHDSVQVTPSRPKDKDQTIKIIAKYSFKKAATNPIFGFRIANAAGEILMGTNSLIQGLNTGEMKSGSKGEIVWSIPNIFEDGTYSVGLAISSHDGVTQYDWWDDAASFTSLRARKTPYKVSPLVGLEFN